MIQFYLGFMNQFYSLLNRRFRAMQNKYIIKLTFLFKNIIHLAIIMYFLTIKKDIKTPCFFLEMRLKYFKGLLE